MTILKKTILIIISVAVIGLTFYYFNNIYGWMEFRKYTDTPERFLNTKMINKEVYAKDSLTISIQLKEFLLRHDDFFYS